jgi:translation initiation factor IF-1
MPGRAVLPRAEGEAVRVGARVLEALPNSLFRVEVQDDARTRLTAHVPGSAGLLRVLPGDLVTVELLPYDATRGRIVGRPS